MYVDDLMKLLQNTTVNPGAVPIKKVDFFYGQHNHTLIFVQLHGLFLAPKNALLFCSVKAECVYFCYTAGYRGRVPYFHSGSLIRTYTLCLFSSPSLMSKSMAIPNSPGTCSLIISPGSLFCDITRKGEGVRKSEMV